MCIKTEEIKVNEDALAGILNSPKNEILAEMEEYDEASQSETEEEVE